MNNAEKILETKALTRVFSETGERLEILKGVDFSLLKNEFCVLTGASGSGKSTFLNLVGALDTPTSGEILFEGKNLSKMSAKEKDEYHAKKVGFVFQFHHLLSEFTALENVCIPARILNPLGNFSEQREYAESLLEKVGLAGRLKHLPQELSGGERQRVAVARALMNRPDVILADEPSGSLDEKNARMLNELFQQIHEDYKQTLLVVTHDERMAEFATSRVHMHGGVVVPFEKESE